MTNIAQSVAVSGTKGCWDHPGVKGLIKNARNF